MFNKFFRLGLALLLVLLTVLAPVASASIELGDDAGYFGDINGDWSYDASDALIMLKAAVGKVKLTARQKACGDVNGDNIVNASDALLMLKFAVGKIEDFPAGADCFDTYQVGSKEEYLDCDATYTPLSNGSFGYDTANSVNGAYATDTTADCSFVMDNTGLQAKTIYSISNAVASTYKTDSLRLIVSLQGLLNRDFGRDGNHTSVIYCPWDGSDNNWLNYCLSDGVYKDYTVVSIKTWDAFYSTFEKQIKQCGMILWDGNVPATSNVAATICGLDGYLPVLATSDLETFLTGKGVATKQTLKDLFHNGQKGQKIAGTSINSTGSAKNDAYRWAMEKYFDRCTSNYLAYTLDGACVISGYANYENNPVAQRSNANLHCITNHDYLIARRCFFFDLQPYAEDAAGDDASQILYCDIACSNPQCSACGKPVKMTFESLTNIEDPVCDVCKRYFDINYFDLEPYSQADVGVDNETMCMLFDRRYQRAKGAIGQLMGFPPWWQKYTTTNGQGTKAATWVEWLFTEYLTAYNMAKEADAAAPSNMTNGSFYYKYVPLQTSYSNHLEAYDPGIKYDKNTLYYTIYMGDYDSSAWLKQRVSDFFLSNNKNYKNVRAEYPITWCFNPNLSNRVPMIFQYLYDNKYNHEFFAAGDSGAGYVIPAALFTGNYLSYSGEIRPGSYPDGDTQWVYYCKKLYDRFDMKATGFMINGSNALTTDICGMYNAFSPYGALHNCTGAMMTNYKGTPYIYCNNGITATTDPQTLYDHAYSRMEGYNFAAYRTVCISPTNLKTIVVNFNNYASGKGKKVQYVELYTLLRLAKQSGQGYKVR